MMSTKDRQPPATTTSTPSSSRPQVTVAPLSVAFSAALQRAGSLYCRSYKNTRHRSDTDTDTRYSDRIYPRPNTNDLGGWYSHCYIHGYR